MRAQLVARAFRHSGEIASGLGVASVRLRRAPLPRWFLRLVTLPFPVGGSLHGRSPMCDLPKTRGFAEVCAISKMILRFYWPSTSASRFLGGSGCQGARLSKMAFAITARGAGLRWYSSAPSLRAPRHAEDLRCRHPASDTVLRHSIVHALLSPHHRLVQDGV